MALYHKWDVKTGFIFARQFFMLISDDLGGVVCLTSKSVSGTIVNKKGMERVGLEPITRILICI